MKIIAKKSVTNLSTKVSLHIGNITFSIDHRLFTAIIRLINFYPEDSCKVKERPNSILSVIPLNLHCITKLY